MDFERVEQRRRAWQSKSKLDVWSDHVRTNNLPESNDIPLESPGDGGSSDVTFVYRTLELVCLPLNMNECQYFTVNKLTVNL